MKRVDSNNERDDKLSLQIMKREKTTKYASKPISTRLCTNYGYFSYRLQLLNTLIYLPYMSTDYAKFA